MRSVQTPDAPAAIGPYSQAVVVGDLVFCSGQIPMDPLTQEVLRGSVAEQTRRVLANLEAVLLAAGSALDKVVKCTVYLRSMDDFAAVNQVYAEVFGHSRPARAAVEVSRLPKDVDVEIEAVAVVR